MQGKITKKRSGAKKQKKAKRSARKSDYLSEVEIMPTQGINLNTPYLWIKGGITGARASQMAKLFGEYRIKKIEYIYRPLFDTFSSSLPGVGNAPNSVPTLYCRLNRYGDVPGAFNANYMRAMGAKPKRLDDKQVVFTYVPNVVQSQQNVAGATTATIKMAPWLSCDDIVADNNFNLSTAQHYGHALFVEGGGAGTAQGAVAYQDCKVYYEFRHPRLTAVPTVDVDPFTGEHKAVPSAITVNI